jgi:molybdenum cofactor cytidylyltransferase
MARDWSSGVRIGAVLLAAGESSRMGQVKALLPWEGQTLLEYQLDQVAVSLCDVVVVVLGHEVDRLRPLIGERPGLEVRVALNARYREGKATSIRVGVAALPDDLSAILVVAVDQPRPTWLLDRLIEEQQRTSGTVLVPAQGGRRGHPPIFAGGLRDELLGVDEETAGLRGVMRRHESEVLVVEVDDPVVHLNLNTPEDYQAALGGGG